MLHYNFPAFSVGETRRMGPTSRREIGHGNLALRALKPVLPDQERFPYVLRVVSEILESNGSSSMATVCSGSLAMMAAGVPISSPVSGIAMGLFSAKDANAEDSPEKYAILSDIAGLEDHFGDMDFKVAGTAKGITAFQMDLKVKGIGIATMKRALEQADRGRLHILEEMNKLCATPRSDVAEGAPRIQSMQIDSSKIGEIIGPGGRVIREIMEQHQVDINVDNDGKVTIVSTSSEQGNQAKEAIETMLRDVQKGDNHTGKVKRLTDFGAFIELFPGKEGLLHISKISEEKSRIYPRSLQRRRCGLCGCLRYR